MLHWLATSAVAAYPSAPNLAAVGGEKMVMRKLASAITSLSLRLSDSWKDWLLHVMLRVSAGGARREGVLDVLGVVIEQVARAELVGDRR